MTEECDGCGRRGSCSLYSLCTECQREVESVLSYRKSRLMCQHDYLPMESIGYFHCVKCGDIKYDLKRWMEERK